MKYIDIEYVDNIKFSRYKFAVNHLKENMSELNVEINIDEKVISLNNIFFNPVLILVYNTSLLHFAKYDFDIEYGRMFENDDECVIAKNSKSQTDSGESDNWNNLDLGDKIVIKNNDGIYKEFTVVGIQKENPEDDINTNKKIIYTTLENAEYFDKIASDEIRSYVIAKIDPYAENGSFDFHHKVIEIGYDALLYLDSYKNYDKLTEKMLNTRVIAEPLFPNFHALVNLTGLMQSNAIAFIVITAFIIICVTIISTVVLLNNRKYEIAVLRSVGIKRSRIITNYII